MRRLVGDPWFWPVLFGSAGLVFLVWGTLRRDVVVLVAALAMLWMLWRHLPQLRVRSRPLAGAQAHVQAGGVVVFWRPGCQYCQALLRDLDPAQRDAVYWVNIWTDKDAVPVLHRLHAGRDGHAHEAVPTVWARRKDFVAADEASRSRLKDMLRDARPAGGPRTREEGPR
ncbi:hypothetical protein [Micrococcus endophyticus]|uniref:hypothetical protein n=1 Tax=Micrococcus endophyticus TaxID=455343 RepID=UPI00130EE168|nr:hypothetical protein [Micrococcus endophyticus]MCK6091623.1 hypothetical protein [Micrococcus endophyticus]